MKILDRKKVVVWTGKGVEFLPLSLTTPTEEIYSADHTGRLRLRLG